MVLFWMLNGHMGANCFTFLYAEKPHNPMVNAGAIIVCSLLKSLVRPEMTLAEKFDYTHHYFKVSKI